MNFLAELKSLLKYHQGIGLDRYPRNDAVSRFLSQTPEVSHGAKLPSTTESSIKSNDNSRLVDDTSSHLEVKPRVNIADIEDEVGLCHACELYKSRIYPVPGRGAGQVRLLIVGDWLSANENGQLPPGHIFGVDQDAMVSRMLTALNLPSADVYITNVIKCAVQASCQPQADHVERCISYLHRQISALQPEVICTMGMVVSRAVLKMSQPLSRLRGKFHSYNMGERGAIPVLATYHPTYLLQNPEMKRATWEDLKLLGKKLGLAIEG